MMLLDEVRGVLVESFAEFEGRHKEHLERVEKGVNWFKGNLVRENESVSGFCGDVVRLEEGEGLCVTSDLRGVPYFNCEFVFKPVDAGSDIGGGVGERYTVKF